MLLDDRSPAWAAIAGYDEAFWPEPGETYVRQSVPEVGAPCLVHSGERRSSGPSWLLYRWWNLDCNGWDTIEDVENTAVILTSLVPVDHQESSQLFTATPITVLRVPDLVTLPPKSTDVGFWDDPFGRVFETTLRQANYYNFGPYHVFDRNFEGDVGMWLICHEAKGAMSALLGCDWSWRAGERFFFAGHGRLTGAEADHLRQFANR
jgi:hypothetical protein